MVNQNQKKALEDQLAALHNRRYCRLVSRGTVGLYLALKTLGYREGKVVVPSIMCLSPANAIIYAGFEPLFCDVSLSDFNLDGAALEKELGKHRDIRAVILPHMYGQPSHIDQFRDLTKKFRVALIEDACQSLGGTYQGKPLGSFGEFSVLSFGHTKIIDVGEGGAILFDEAKYQSQIDQEYKKLPERAKSHAKLQEHYSQAYYHLATLYRSNKSFGRLYYAFAHIFKDLYLYRSRSTGIIPKFIKELPRLSGIVAKRRERAQWYQQFLNHPRIVHPHYRWEGVCWRYSFLVKSDNQQELAETIRKKGIHVSNWYPPVHELYCLQPPQMKNAEFIGRHIFNLWVDPRYSRRDVKRISDVVLSVVEKFKT
jgi:dTDP-4-amino-4,6-dideoxygalactose transaminase